jgi:hypothetical protein
MDMLMEVLVSIASAVVSLVVPPLVLRAVTSINANIHDKRVSLIADAATRAAGRIAVGVADQMNRPGVNLKAAVMAAAASEVATLKAQLPDTIAKVAASDTTLRDMIAGEVGKLVGQVVKQ